jgi:hypothetical protein
MPGHPGAAAVPTAVCPECGRAIPVTAAEVRSGLILECAGCDTRFRAARHEEPLAVVPAPRSGLRLSLTVAAGLLAAALAAGASWMLFRVAEGHEQFFQDTDQPAEKKFGLQSPTISALDAGVLYARLESDPKEFKREFQDKKIRVHGQVLGWRVNEDQKTLTVVIQCSPRGSRFADRQVGVIFVKNPPGSKSDWPGFDLKENEAGTGMIAPWDRESDFVAEGTVHVNADAKPPILIIGFAELK